MYTYKGEVVNFNELPLWVKVTLKGAQVIDRVCEKHIIVSIAIIIMLISILSIYSMFNDGLVLGTEIDNSMHIAYLTNDTELNTKVYAYEVEREFYEGNKGYFGADEAERLRNEIEKYELNNEIITHKKANEIVNVEFEKQYTLDEYSKFTEKDIVLMAQVVYGEARGESYEGKKAVAAVIINRVKSSRYPNTVEKVISQGNGSQFNCIREKSFGQYNEECIQAVLDIIENNPYPANMLYYANVEYVYENNMDIKFAKYIKENAYAKIGRHTFALGS